MEKNIQEAIQFSKEHQNEFIADLGEFLRFKSISSDPVYKGESQKCAQWIVDYLKKMGAGETRILPTDRNPVVYGSIQQAGKDKPTILIYGHYDVMPPDPLEEWKSEPFEPVVKDGKLFARGSADMKGQVMVIFAAIQSIIARGKWPVNLKFLLEGDEELGSPGIVPFLEKHKDLLKADFVLNLDAGMVARDKPTIVYGLRGLAYFEISISDAEHDLHSGLYGGLIYNPIQALCELVAGLKDENGVIQLPGFYDDVKDLDEEKRKALNENDNADEYYQAQTGIKAVFGEKGYSNVERLGIRPSLDLNGIRGGYIGEGPKTVIPAKAFAKLSTRLVPDQSPLKVKEQLIQYMRENAPSQINWEVKLLATDPSSVTDMNFYGAQCLARSLEKVWGEKVLFKREGISIPIVAHFQDVLGMESVLSGFTIPEDRMHSPNERLNLDLFEKGIEAMIDFFYRVTDEK